MSRRAPRTCFATSPNVITCGKHDKGFAKKTREPELGVRKQPTDLRRNLSALMKRQADAAKKAKIDRSVFEGYVREIFRESLFRENELPWTEQRVNEFFDKKKNGFTTPRTWFQMNPYAQYTYEDSTLTGTVLHILNEIFRRRDCAMLHKLRTIDPCVAILKYLISQDPRLARFTKISDALKHDTQLARAEFRGSADFDPPLIFVIEVFANPARGIPDEYIKKLCKIFVDAWKPSLSIKFLFGNTPLELFKQWPRDKRPWNETVKVLTPEGGTCCVQ